MSNVWLEPSEAASAALCAAGRALYLQQHSSRSASLHLVAADKMGSRIVYEIGERQPAPRILIEQYPALADAWVFGLEEVAL